VNLVRCALPSLFLELARTATTQPFREKDMSRSAKEVCTPVSHISVAVSQGERVIGYRILDAAAEYQPLVNELAWRVVSSHPQLGGAEWTLDLRLEGIDTEQPYVQLEALSNGKSGRGDVLADMRVPVTHFAWIAEGIAAQFKVDGEYKYHVAVVEKDSPLLKRWNELDKDDDFELLSDVTPKLILPRDFTTEDARRPRQVIDAKDTFLRCVFAGRAFEEFLSAARRETQERSWAGLGHVRVPRPGVCETVVEELADIPGEAGEAWVWTRGRDFARVHAEIGDRLVGFLHLHPRKLTDKETGKTQALAPHPSANDAVCAWNVQVASAAPAVFPIALLGADPARGEVAAHGYDHGLLSGIQLEVES